MDIILTVGTHDSVEWCTLLKVELFSKRNKDKKMQRENCSSRFPSYFLSGKNLQVRIPLDEGACSGEQKSF